jgi:hypothetical protein
MRPCASTSRPASVLASGPWEVAARVFIGVGYVALAPPYIFI